MAFYRARDRSDFYRTVQKIYRLRDARTKTYFAVALKENYFAIPGTRGLKP